MKVKSHFTINGYEDNVIFEADTLEEIREENKNFMQERGLDAEKNHMWSEEIK